MEDSESLHTLFTFLDDPISMIHFDFNLIYNRFMFETWFEKSFKFTDKELSLIVTCVSENFLE